MNNQPSATATSSSPSKSRKTEILYGAENAVAKGVEFMNNVRERMDICFDHRAPSIVIEIPEYRNGYKDIRKRGGAIRVVTDITKENLNYCKQLMDLVDLRHLPGIKGGIAVNETEYMATTVLEEAKPLTEVIYSNVPEMVSQGHHIFDVFWDNATPAEYRIREIELGIVRRKTRIMDVKDQIAGQIVHLVRSSSYLCLVSPSGGLQLVHRDFLDLYKQAASRMASALTAQLDNGSSKRIVGTSIENRGIRWITSIDHDGINIVKSLLSIGIKIRHVKTLPPVSFALGDLELNASIERMEGGKMVESLLTSNESAYIGHFEGIFARLWSEGIDAEERIVELETGLEAADIEIVRNPRESIGRAWRLVTSAKNEVLLLLSTSNAFRRQLRMGGLDVLRKASTSGCSIRILIPADIEMEKEIEQLRRELPYVDIRAINERLRTNISILITDEKECIIFELRDDTKTESYDAVGISLYSISHSIVSSYKTIIESLWTETELYERVKMHDQRQRDFLDIATHELRTPIQPIVGLAEILSARFRTDSEEKEFIDAILRNAKRLYKLTESLLDVTKIESKTLQLKRERFDLDGLIRAAINDSLLSTGIARSDIRIEYHGENVEVLADRVRIYQVVSNILNNAIRFTNKGSIVVSLQAAKRNEHHSRHSSTRNRFATVRISDTGPGIAPEIYPDLFSKFVSSSPTSGTGLGLYISRAIIEQHGGRIWAENRPAGQGAEFAFTLPLYRHADARSQA